MWCLIHLERESPNALVSLLKEKAFEVHIAPDLDDLLDALWYHGSSVGCIVAETRASKGLQELFEALKDWPKLKVLVFGLIDEPLKEDTQIHVEPSYNLASVSRWLGGPLPGSRDGGSAL